MSLLTWGMLPKSQIDDETIEEAIDRLIAVHEADEEAHLGVGDSLQSHKAAEIIDHLALSVVRDKINFDRFNIDEFFATIDSWHKSAGVALDEIAQMTLTTTSVENNKQYAYIAPGDSQGDAAAVTQNPTWQTRVQFASTTNQVIYIIQGDEDGPAGFGFKVTNGTLYGVWFENDSDEITEELQSVSAETFYILRCELVDGVDLKFYVNGVLKHTEADPDIASAMVFMRYSIKTTTTAARTMYVQNLHWDADYSN